MKRLTKLLISTITICTILLPLNIVKSQEKIEIISLIKKNKGLGEKKFRIQDGNKQNLDSLKL